jgi:glycerol uptake operon antiterminator
MHTDSARFFETLRSRPVIAAVRDVGFVPRAAESPVPAVFLLGGSILTLPAAARALKEAGKRVFVHLDLCAGLGRDKAAVEWCQKALRPDGLISTHPQLLREAAGLGMATIQRLFLMDSGSLSNGIRLLKSNPPDFVEVLPGLVPKAISELCAQLNRPVIAGGMITERDEVARALMAGAVAVSTSEQALWEDA